MYTFDDRLSGESLTLRPEATAGIVRAAIEHNLCTTGRSASGHRADNWHERSAEGRYRQFHQSIVEALGFEGPDVDAEQIAMLARLWRELASPTRSGSSINSDRRRARATRAPRDPIAYFERHRRPRRGCEGGCTRTRLRILDSKTPAMV